MAVTGIRGIYGDVTGNSQVSDLGCGSVMTIVKNTLLEKHEMTTQQIADELVKLCSAGKFNEATEALYSDDIVSMEAGAPPGGSREAKGIAAIKAKGEWWAANHDVHGVLVEGPLVAGSHFAVTFKMDVTFKADSRRFTMEEVAVYKVADGKIVYEEFFYSM